MYNIVIQCFYGVYCIQCYYKTLTLFPVLYITLSLTLCPGVSASFNSLLLRHTSPLWLPLMCSLYPWVHRVEKVAHNLQLNNNKSLSLFQFCYFHLFYLLDSPSLVAQRVKRLPTMQETRVQHLGWEDPLEKEMATHSSTLARKIPWTEEPSRLQSMESQSQTQLRDFTFTFFRFHILVKHRVFVFLCLKSFTKHIPYVGMWAQGAGTSDFPRGSQEPDFSRNSSTEITASQF